MHPNPAFHTEMPATNLDFARERGFGQLSVAHGGLPLAAHVPFVLSDDGKHADLHLLRSNPISRAADGPLPALLAVSGPDSYISPDWYDTPDQVPTWNYVAVHLCGQLVPLPQDEIRTSLDRLTESFERRLAPKPVWTAEKMPSEALERMMRTIRPFRLEIAQIDGTWKLNQNKPAAARLSAATHVDAYGIGTETALLAALMRGVGPDGHR